MKDLTVVVIGAGTKGALYPDERLTHAHAFSQNGFKLLGFCDKDRWRAAEAGRQWGVPSTESLESALSKQPDVVTVAVSDTAHYEVLKAITKQEHKPRLVFTEKPFCQNHAQAEEIADLYQEKGIALSVNFTRRFLPEFQKLNTLTLSVMTGFFTKGIHNLSHLVDLALLIGVETIEPIEIDRRDLNVFEAELYGSSGKLSIRDHGERIHFIPSKPRPDYPEEMVLDYLREVSYPVDLHRAMDLAAQNIHAHLTDGTPLLSTVENALKVMEACEQWQ